MNKNKHTIIEVVLKQQYYKQGSQYLQKYWVALSFKDRQSLKVNFTYPVKLDDAVIKCSENGWVIKSIEHLSTYELEHLNDLCLYSRLEAIHNLKKQGRHHIADSFAFRL